LLALKFIQLIPTILWARTKVCDVSRRLFLWILKHKFDFISASLKMCEALELNCLTLYVCINIYVGVFMYT
jgi:maltodextrin utilization protein YvdJ